jgi:hypothetical protein
MAVLKNKPIMHITRNCSGNPCLDAFFGPPAVEIVDN